VSFVTHPGAVPIPAGRVGIARFVVEDGWAQTRVAGLPVSAQWATEFSLAGNRGRQSPVLSAEWAISSPLRTSSRPNSNSFP